MELKDLIALYLSGFAAFVALATLAYQWWRDFLSTVPAVTVMSKLDGSDLDVAIYVKRNPTVVVEVGLCTLFENGRIQNSEVLSEMFQVIGNDDSVILRNILNTGVKRELFASSKYKIFIQVVGGKKFYSQVFLGNIDPT